MSQNQQSNNKRKITDNRKFKIWGNTIRTIIIFSVLMVIYSIVFRDSNIFSLMNGVMNDLSVFYSNIPIYKHWVSPLSRHELYNDFHSVIDEGIISSTSINDKWIEFYFKCFFESIPLFIGMLLVFSPVKKSIVYKYYGEVRGEVEILRNKLINETSPERQTKIMMKINNIFYPLIVKRYRGQIDYDAMKHMREIILSEGQSELRKQDRRENIEDIIERNKKFLDSYTFRLYENIDKYILEDENYIINSDGVKLNRELFFPTLDKEVSIEEFKRYCKVVMYFYLAKLNANFKMYQYSECIEDLPHEIRILCKWIGSEQVPSVEEIFVKTKYGTSKKYSEIYYRGYRMLKYMGIHHSHCELQLFGEPKREGVKEVHRLKGIEELYKISRYK